MVIGALLMAMTVPPPPPPVRYQPLEFAGDCQLLTPEGEVVRANIRVSGLGSARRIEFHADHVGRLTQANGNHSAHATSVISRDEDHILVMDSARIATGNDGVVEPSITISYGRRLENGAEITVGARRFEYVAPSGLGYCQLRQSQ